MREKVQDSAAEPMRDEAPTRGPVCKKCGFANAPGAERCKCGSGLPGNAFALKHGGFSRKDRPEFAAIRAATEAWTADVRVSQGGDDLAPVRDGAVENLGSLEYLKRLLIADLKANGLHTKSKKGPPRVRSSFPLLLQVLDRWSRYAAILGLDARRKDVIESPREWLERISEQEHESETEGNDDEHAQPATEQTAQTRTDQQTEPQTDTETNET